MFYYNDVIMNVFNLNQVMLGSLCPGSCCTLHYTTLLYHQRSWHIDRWIEVEAPTQDPAAMPPPSPSHISIPQTKISLFYI